MMIRDGIWDFNKLRPIHEFSEYNVGIFGLGKVGKLLGKKLILFGFNVLYVNDIDGTVVDRIDYSKNVRLTILKELLKNSHFISLNILLINKTYHLINKNILKYLREGTSIINTSRRL